MVPFPNEGLNDFKAPWYGKMDSSILLLSSYVLQVNAFGILSENQLELPKGFNDPNELRVTPDPVHYDSLGVQGTTKFFMS